MNSNWHKKFYIIGWEELRSKTFVLSQKILSAHLQLDLIVAIARGGLMIAQLLSDGLGLPIAAFTVESYKNFQQVFLPLITHGLTSSLKRKKILLVDDISDTGKTFLRALDYLEELGAHKSNVTTCALVLKPDSVYKPHYFIEETSVWVIFPYEVRETITQLVPVWKKDKVSTEETRRRFTSLGFPENQIETYLTK